MKKIFSLLMAAVLSISTAFATTVYCKMTHNWWTQDGAAVGVHYWGGASAATTWPGVRMTPVTGEEGTWTYDVPADVEGLMFVRVNGSGDIADWGAKTANLTLPTDGKNLYTITSTAAVWGDPGVTGEWSVYGEEPTPYVPTLANGFYLIGKINGVAGWEVADLAADRKFEGNPENNAEFVLTTTLADGDEIKVVNVLNDAITDWYPASGGNYVVDAAHAGEKTIYFRPDGQGGEDWFGACIYIAPNETPTPQPVSSYIFEWVKGEGAKIEADNTDLNANNMGTMTAGTSVVARMLGTNAIDNNAKGYKLGNNDVCVEIEGTSAFAVGDTVIITGVCGGSGARAFAIAPTTTINAVTDTALTNTQENTSDILEYRVIVKEAQAGDKMRIFRMAGKTMYLYSIKVARPAGDTPEPPVAAKFYVTGDSALVTDAGFAGKAWNPDAIKSEADTLVLNLKAETDYVLKVTVNGTWEGENNVKGYNELTEKTDGLLDVSNDHNIGFKLNEAGVVKVVYIAAANEQPEVFKLIGNFYVAPKVAYYLIGDSAFVVDAGATADKAWTPDAIPCLTDTTVLNLKAGVDYIMRLSLNGTWENHRDFRHLTDTAAGLKELPDEYQNRSIGFRLNEAGPVTIIYIPAAEEQPEVFKLIGNFHVDEPADPTAAVTGDMTEWGEPIPFELSEDSTFATLYNDNIKKGTYEFKMIINGDWRSNGYEFHRGFPGCAGITGNAEANMTVVIDVDGAYTFKWYFANDSLAIIYPEKPEPVLTNGYYLVGKFGGVDAWDPIAANLFAVNPENENEYQLAIDLAVDDEVKVVYVENGAIVTWFPAEGGNYVIDDHHSGATTMYFRPEYNSDWSAFGGYFYIVPTSTVGFENTAADAKVVKSLKNGILVIEKNNKVYNVLGIEMK